MACNICEATNYFNILNKVSIPVWTGSSEIEVAELFLGQDGRNYEIRRYNITKWK